MSAAVQVEVQRTQHSIAPWRQWTGAGRYPNRVPKLLEIRSAAGETLAYVCTMTALSREEVLRNAALMESAPEMYQLLVDVAERLAMIERSSAPAVSAELLLPGLQAQARTLFSRIEAAA